MNHVTDNLISIIIPVKNEPYLINLLDDLKQILQPYNHEIIITTNIMGILSPQQQPSNITIVKSYADSLERAILLGFSVAHGNKIIVMDADGSHSPKLLPEMIRELDNYEMVMASRFTTDGHYITSIFRYFVSFLFNQYARLLGSTLTDPMSGYFGIQSQILPGIKFRPYKWKIGLEINNKARPNTKEIPLTFINRKNGKSKTNWKIGLKLLWDILVDAL